MGFCLCKDDFKEQSQFPQQTRTCPLFVFSPLGGSGVENHSSIAEGPLAMSSDTQPDCAGLQQKCTAGPIFYGWGPQGYT